MKKKLLPVVLGCLLLSVSAEAQVRDVSITVTPKIGYNWFDPKSTVENGTTYGLQAGFGFGKVIELRGIWERSLDLKQNFGQYEGDIQELFPNFNFQDRSIRVQRIGGEFKTNIPIDGFAPYLILGTGVQKFETKPEFGDSYTNENLYGSGGLGFKINIGDRTTFNIEGRGLVYNMNPGSLLYNPGGTSEFDDWINNTDRSTMYNWSIMAGLQFYLGGSTDDELDALDRAYLRRFSGGMSGTKVTLSPGGAYLNFDGNSPYRDTYMLGGILGIDFSHYAGLQGYYYRSTRDEKVSFDFDDLEMYGADFVGKLNVPRGIVPYLSIGGGYLKARDNYVGKPIVDGAGAITGHMTASSGYYAKGGVGVDVPISRYVQVFGGANLLYTMQDQSADIAELRNANQLDRHTMYNVGLRLNIGRGGHTDRATDRAFDSRFEAERNEYDARIATLEEELREAYERNDTEKALQIMEEKKSLDSIQTNGTPSDGLIRMTPAELEKLIEKVLDGVDSQSQLTVEDRLARIEQLLMMSTQTGTPAYALPTAPVTTSTNSDYDSLIQQLNELKSELEEQKRQAPDQPVTVQPGQPSRVQPVQPTTTVTPTSTAPAVSHLQAGYTPYVGVNFGHATTMNVGLRGYYAFARTSILFAPEAYLGIGDGVGFGVSANGVLPFRTNSAGATPYAGLGVGIHSLGGTFSFTTNVIGGVAYRVGNGSLTADYTVRGAFKNNQLAVGYRFSF